MITGLGNLWSYLKRRRTFLKSVAREFKYLEEQYNFRVARRNADFVEYTSSHCNVMIIFERPEELTVAFGEGPITPSREMILRSRTIPLSPALDPSVTVTLYDVACTFEAQDRIERTFAPILNTSDIPQAVTTLARLTRQYAGPLLCGVPDAFRSVWRNLAVRSVEYNIGIILRSLPPSLAESVAGKSLAEVEAIAAEYRRSGRGSPAA